MRRKLSSQSESNDFWEDHGDGLAEHHGFSFDTSDSPTSYSQSVDHGCVRVSSNERIWVQHAIRFEYYSSKIFQVHLMDDTTSWWDNKEVLEGALSPLQELEPFLVSVELNLFIPIECIGRSGNVDLDGVVDDQVRRTQRVYFVLVSAQPLHGVSHRGQVDNRRHSREVLQNNSGWLEWDLDILGRSDFPVQDILNIRLEHIELVAVSDGSLEQNSDTVRQFGNSLITKVGK
mmetsp:Transcript_2226/g.2889  ORF Transcript_2226/g.2889 Transcript_2226/m.2889 type:complete len:232 (-) Transcript_2226:68-763(-)